MLFQLALPSLCRNNTRRIYTLAYCIGEDEVCLRVGLRAGRVQAMRLPVPVKILKAHIMP